MEPATSTADEVLEKHQEPTGLFAAVTMPGDIDVLPGVPTGVAGGAGRGGTGHGGSAHGHGDGSRGVFDESDTGSRTANAQPRSSARPPRLIYPRKDRPERAGQVFIVILTVDKHGYVDGVRLKQGVNPHKDQKALDAIWRFRYKPALDDVGRPIAYKLEQRFMLE